jgi:hypothetical protein
VNSNTLNEHDANQGAQSSGEFLGMTGNSGWYLLGSGGATIMMVIFLWGVLGVSLLLCLFVGILLCVGSVVYVFTLKNNRPQHYDTDFFESSLVEAGVLGFRFSPRAKRFSNPFLDLSCNQIAPDVKASAPSRKATSRFLVQKTARGIEPGSGPTSEPSKEAKAKKAPEMVSKAEYDTLKEKLEYAEEALEEAMEGGDDL